MRKHIHMEQHLYSVDQYENKCWYAWWWAIKYFMIQKICPFNREIGNLHLSNVYSLTNPTKNIPTSCLCPSKFWTFDICWTLIIHGSLPKMDTINFLQGMTTIKRELTWQTPYFKNFPFDHNHNCKHMTNMLWTRKVCQSSR